jgi:hypothetical protein
MPVIIFILALPFMFIFMPNEKLVIPSRSVLFVDEFSFTSLELIITFIKSSRLNR